MFELSPPLFTFPFPDLPPGLAVTDLPLFLSSFPLGGEGNGAVSILGEFGSCEDLAISSIRLSGGGSGLGIGWSDTMFSTCLGSTSEQSEGSFLVSRLSEGGSDMWVGETNAISSACLGLLTEEIWGSFPSAGVESLDLSGAG